MAIILINRTEQLVTSGDLTKDEITIVKTMITLGKSFKEIEDYLLKCDHIVLGKENTKDMSVIVINSNQLDEKELKELFDYIMNINSL